MRVLCCLYCEHAAQQQLVAIEHERRCPGHKHLPLQTEQVPAMLIRRTVGYVACVGDEEQQQAAQRVLEIARDGGDITAIALPTLLKTLERDPSLKEHALILRRARSGSGAPPDTTDVVRFDVSRMLSDHVTLLLSLLRRKGWQLWLLSSECKCVYAYCDNADGNSPTRECVQRVLGEYPDATAELWVARDC